LTDTPIATVLAQLGFRSEEEQAAGRAALEAAGLTRAGKHALHESKLPAAERVLSDRFAFTCASCAADAHAARPAVRQFVVTDDRCESCGGSANGAAASRFVAACRAAGVRRVLIVGGNPATRDVARRLLSELDVTLIDGTVALPSGRARQLTERAELILVWGATQLDHRVSKHFTDIHDPKVVRVARRGLAALLSSGTLHLGKVNTRTAHQRRQS
jgi:hypothetical protein